MDLLQIVPMLPPAVSGVGDYALLLARQLTSAHGVQTRFLNGDPDWRGHEASVAPFPAEAVSERSASALWQALERASTCDAVLLHYVGHGYARRGCPFWLVRALEEWKRRTQKRLIVLFHEVSGSGPIWTSGFWTSGIQSRLAGKLARLADVRRITTEIAAKRLRTMLPEADAAVRTLAVFSTLGEPTVLIPYRERRRQMVVFGGGGWRKEAYTRYLPDLAEACRHMEIERVIDIGVPVDIRPDLRVPFVETGVLAAGEASDLMNRSAAGFFTYPVAHIGKSTIFAAYCAHGMTPVTYTANLTTGDENLHPNEHFLARVHALPLTRDGKIPAEIASSAHAWYRQHRLAVHAHEIYRTVVDAARA